MKKSPLDRPAVAAGTKSKEDYIRLGLALHAIGGGIWDYDVNGDQLMCDERWYGILGVDPLTHPITRIADFKPFIHADDVAQATSIDLDGLNLLLERDERYFKEFRILRADGAVRWVRSIATVVRDDAGHVRAVGCMTDITGFQGPALDGYAGPEQAERDAASPPPPQQETVASSSLLSDRERECLLWVSLGKTAWETATILQISQRTIEFHLRNATDKLDATNKVHAVVTAIRMGLL